MQAINYDRIVLTLCEAARNSPLLLSAMVIVGGSSITMQGGRDSHDMDVYIDKKAQHHVGALINAALDHDIEIDWTPDTTLWGDIDLFDPKLDVRIIPISPELSVAALSPESLFILKCSSMREKDIDDLPFLLSKTNVKSILDRFSHLWEKSKDHNATQEALINILSEVQLIHLDPLNTSVFQDIQNTSIRQDMLSFAKTMGLVRQEFHAKPSVH